MPYYFVQDTYNSIVTDIDLLSDEALRGDHLAQQKQRIADILRLDQTLRNTKPPEDHCSLEEFVKEFWSIIEPENKLVWNWHLSAICQHLEAVINGEIRNLIINIPPRMSKSTIVAVMWPCWAWTFKPHLRWIFASYGSNLSERDSTKCKRLIRSGPYQSKYGRRYQIRKDHDTVEKFETTRGGFRIATSVDGMATGEGGDIIVCDDPLKASDGNSPAKRDSTNRWWAETMPSRLDNQKTGCKVIVMQRVAEMDLTGYILENSPGLYEWICIPMEYEVPRDDHGKVLPKPKTCLGFEDPRTYDGELLCEERIDRTEIEHMKSQMTEYAWAGQFQQRPSPRGGGIFRVDKIDVIPMIPADAKLIRIRAWDRAGTQGGGAYTAGVRMALDVVTNVLYIEDVNRGQWGPDIREAETLKTARNDGLNVYIVLEQEPGSAGIDSVTATMKMLFGFRVAKDKVSGDKVMRAEPLATQVSIGQVKLILGKWNNAFIKELENFPNGHYKDQVDSASLGFNWLARMRTMPREPASTPVPDRPTLR